MTTKILRGHYASAYRLMAPVTTLSIAGTGYVAGSATYGVYTGAAATAAYTVVNHGTVMSGGTAVSLGDGGLVINGTPGGATPLIAGATGVAIAGAAGTVENFATIDGGKGDEDAGVVLVDGGSVTNGSASDTKASIYGYGAGVLLAQPATITNFGTISANAAKAGVVMGGGGQLTNGSPTDTKALIEEGVVSFPYGDFPAPTVTNFGSIEGAVALGAAAKLVNGSATDVSAVVDGGATVAPEGAPGTVVNFGTIAGRTGLSLDGSLTNGAASDITARIEGPNGVTLTGSGAVTNFGTILGFYTALQVAPSSHVTNGSAADATAIIGGGDGVILSGAGTLINFGTIWGIDTAVVFSSSSDVLIAEGGSDLDGQVTGGGGALDLRAGATGTIDGVSGFGKVSFASDASWVFDGYDDMATGLTDHGAGAVDVAGTLATFGSIDATMTVGGELSVEPGKAMSLVGGTLTNLDAGTLTGGAFIIGAGGRLQMPDDDPITTLDAVIELGGPSASLQSLDTTTSRQIGLASSLATIGAAGALDILGGESVASAGTIDNAGAIDVADGALNLSAGTLANLSGGTLTGGTFEVGADSALQLADNSAVTVLDAGIDLAGADWSVQSLQTSTADEVTLAQSLASIGAAGELELSGGASFTSSASLTNAGTVDVADGTLTDVGLVNTGLVTGYGVIVGAMTNFGTISGGLTIDGPLVAYGGADFKGRVIGDGGSLALEGGATPGTIAGISGFDSVNIAAGASWVLDGPATIDSSWTIAPTASVTVAGSINAQGELTGTLTNDNYVSVTPGQSLSLQDCNLTNFSGDTLSGGWMVGAGSTLQMRNNQRIVALGGVVFLNGPDATIQSLNTSQGVDINLGSTLARVNVLAILDMYGGSGLALGRNFNNDGTVSVEDSTLTASGTIQNEWYLDLSDGAVISAQTIVNRDHIIASSGTIIGTLVNNGNMESGDVTIDGPVTGGGAVYVGGTITFEGAFSERVYFLSGDPDELRLAESQDFTNIIYSFGADGGSTLDLGDIAFGTTTTALYSGNTTTGVLTVTDGTHTARIHLDGDYLASTWDLASDGQGGTTVVASTATPGPSAHVLASAAAGFAATHAGGACGGTASMALPHPLLAGPSA